MKAVLVPTEPHDVMESVLQTALLVQKRFDSYLEGFALRPAIPDYVPIDMVSGLAWHVDERADEDARRQSHSLFKAFMSGNGLGPEGTPTSRYGWHPRAPAGDAFMVGHVRAFDLVVLGRPLVGKAQPSMATLEAALFEAGRPLLIAPPKPPASLGETVVVAWNGSTETARAVAYAMPFLLAARRVVVLTIEGWSNQGSSPDLLTANLRRNGVAAERVEGPDPKRDVGAAILMQVAALEGDLLVKGAYTQSRLRQLIFGGATAHILANATVPVLMAN